MLPTSIQAISNNNNRLLKLAILFAVIICIGLLISELTATDLTARSAAQAQQWYSGTQAQKFNVTEFNLLKQHIALLESEVQQLRTSDTQHKYLIESAKSILVDNTKQYGVTVDALQQKLDDVHKQMTVWSQNTDSSQQHLTAHTDLLVEKSYPYFFNAMFVVSLREGRWEKFRPQFNDWPELNDIMYHLESTDGTSINITQWQEIGKLTPEFHTLSREIVQGQYIRQMARGELGCADSHIRAWERCVALNLNWCWIAEDDAVINRSTHEPLLKGLKAELEAVNLFHTFDVLWLGWTWGGWRVIEGSKTLVHPDNIDFIVTHSYIVSNAGARKLLQNKWPIKMPIDCYMAQQTHYKGNDLLTGILYNPEPVKTFKDTWSDTQGIQ